MIDAVISPLQDQQARIVRLIQPAHSSYKPRQDLEKQNCSFSATYVSWSLLISAVRFWL